MSQPPVTSQLETDLPAGLVPDRRLQSPAPSNDRSLTTRLTPPRYDSSSHQSSVSPTFPNPPGLGPAPGAHQACSNRANDASSSAPGHLTTLQSSTCRGRSAKLNQSLAALCNCIPHTATSGKFNAKSNQRLPVTGYLIKRLLLLWARNVQLAWNSGLFEKERSDGVDVVDLRRCWSRFFATASNVTS